MMKIPFSPPDITQAEIDEVVDTLKSGWITTGPKTKKLEKELSDYLGTAGTVCLNSATIAMEFVLRYLGVGPGDEVITSAYTYTASASVIHHVGAKIVLADCLPDSNLIDPEDAARRITSRTKAIIPVHVGGVMADTAALMAWAEKKKDLFRPANERQAHLGRLVILADAAHSLGSSNHGVMSGQDADFSCFSFHAVKNFTTAEGGCITWPRDRGYDSEALYQEFMLLALHGQNKDALAKLTPGSWEYDIVYPGFKGNMTDIMAAIGLVQLKRYPDLLARRKEIIRNYNRSLKDLPYAKPMAHEGNGMHSCGHLYIVNLEGFTPMMRNEVILQMGREGVATNVHYKPLPMMSAYQAMGFDIQEYPKAYHHYENEVTLPLHTLLSDADCEYVMEVFKKTCEQVRNRS
ncbi:UDP-4-amino-4-deoxy-L-arabinose--oxoglutarate aminotransferase [Clostridiaceae bacterium JG1575]|nr:UDP-4-amino-4-deoxy-L-arabinose--oxoglutarate aminotransferase [Clostridiaceae bacterium JG1575]